MKFYESKITHPISGEEVTVYCKESDQGITAVCSDLENPFIIKLPTPPEDQTTIQPSFYKDRHTFTNNLTN